MAEKDDFDLDGMDFDSFDDDFDFDGGFDTGDAGTRGPFSRIAHESKQAFKEKVKSPSFYARILKAAAPSKFSAIFDIGESLTRSSESLYNKAVEEASPVGKVLGKQLKRMLPAMRGTMPEKIYKTLDDALSHEEGYVPPSKHQQTEDAVADAMGEFSDRQEKVEGVRYTEERKRFSFAQRAEQMRHGEMSLIGKTIARNQKRQIGFSEKVLYKLHRKSLEVQFRSLYAIRDLTEINREGQRLMLEQLKVIAERSAFPDAVKLRNSEMFKQMMRESLFSRVQSKFGGPAANIIDNVSDVISKKVTGAITDIKDMVMQGSDMADMLDEDMMYSAGADMGVDAAASAGGGFMGKVLGKNRKAKRWMDNKGARLARNTAEFGNNAADWFRMNPEALDDKDKRWWKGNTDVGGVDKDGNPIDMNSMQAVGGWLAKMIRDVGSEAITYKDDLGIKNADAFMGKQALFTNKVASSITDVIPGLLAMQLSEQIHMRTGAAGDLLKYDYGNGKFITDAENKREVDARLRKAVSPGSARRQTNEAVDEVDRSKELDDETRKHLKTQLLVNSYEHRSLDAKNFSRSDQFHASIPEESRAKLIEFFKKNYTFKDNEPHNRFRDQRIANAKSTYADLSRILPAILDELQNQYLAGNGDYLIQIGAMKKSGNDMTFNPDYVLKLLNTVEKGDDDIETQEKAKNSITDAIMAAAAAMKPSFDEYSDKAADYVAKKMEEHGIYEKVSAFADSASRRTSVIARWESRKLQRKFSKAKADGWKETIKAKLTNAKDKSKKLAEDVYDKMNKFVTDKEFRDEATGLVVSRLEDLKGNIVDKNGKLLITKEDVMAKIDELLEKPGASQDAFDYVAGKTDSLQQAAKARLDELGVSDKLTGYKADADKLLDTAKGYNYKEAVEKKITTAKGYFDKLKETILQKIGRGEAVTEAEIATAINLSEPTAPLGAGPSSSSSEIKSGLNVGDGSNFQGQGVNDRLDKLIELTTENRGYLEAIAVKEISGVIMQGGVDPKLIEKLLKEKNPGFLRKLGGLGLTFGKAGVNILSGIGHVTKASGKFFGGAINKVGGMALDTAGWMWGGTKRMLGFYSDIYVRGEKVPVLDVKGLRKGIYKDVNSGKRIKVYKDITGPVMNLETNTLALTQAEFDKGLYDYSGKPIVGNILRKIGSIYAGLLTPLVYGAKAVAATARAVYGTVFNNPDVYTKTDLSTPKLYAKLMENNQYFSKSTGKPVRSFKDIDGEVIDRDNNICLSLGDLKIGLVDYRGKALKSNFEKFILNPAKAVARGIIAVGVTGVKAGWGIMKALGRGAAGLFSGVKRGFFNGKNDEAKISAMANMKTNDILLQIYNLLNDRLPGGKHFGDNDGDGDRDGSAADIAKAHADKSAEAQAAAASAKGGSGGFFDKMKGMLGGLFGGKDKEEEDDDDDGDTYIDASKDSDKKDGKKGKRGKGVNKSSRMKPPGSNGWWSKMKTGMSNSKWLNATKGFFTRGFGGRALGTLGRFGKRGLVVAGLGAAAMWLGGPIGALLAGAAAVLGMPIIGAALAIGTVGYLAYQGYKWYKGSSGWEAVLMAHYGLKNVTGEQREALGLLHADMEESFKGNEESGNATIKQETVAKVAKQWGVTEEKDQKKFIQWIVSRVRPVFIRIKTALMAYSKRITVLKADDLPNDQLLAFLKRIEYNNAAAPMYETLPAPVESAQIMYVRDLQILQRKYTEEISKKATKGLANGTGEAGLNAGLYTAIDGKSENAVAGKDPGALKPDATTAGFTMGAMAGGEVKNQLKGSLSGSPVRVDDALVMIDKVRYFCYGLRELDATKVATLRAMEEDLAPTVKFGRFGTPSMGGRDKDFLELYAQRFGVNVKDPAATTRWLNWFHGRFLTVFFAFMAEVNAQTGATSDFFTRARKQSSVEMGKIGTAMLNAKNRGWFGKSIWAITDSPWENYTLLNDSKGPYNICMDLLSGAAKVDSALLYASKSKSGSGSGDVKPPVAGTTPAATANNPSGTTSTPSGSPTPQNSGAYNSNVTRAMNGNPTAVSSPGGDPKADMPPSVFGKYSGLEEGNRVSAKQPVGDYQLPTGGTVSSSFKIRKHPTLGVTRRHAGIDIAAAKGTEVYAVNSGTVLAIGDDEKSGMGKYVFIMHPDGIQSRYLHLNSIHSTMKAGVKVTKGQLIGTVGMTGGQSSGPHLHLAMVKGDGTGTNVEFLDPAQFFDDQAKKGASTAASPTATDTPAVPSMSATAPVGGGSATSPLATPSAPAVSKVPPELAPTAAKPVPVVNGPTAAGGSDLNDMIEGNAHMQDKIKRIGDENKVLAANMAQAVTHLKSIDGNINELVGIMRGTSGGSSKANTPPPRTAKANIVNLSK